jgi:hypothetical protein
MRHAIPTILALALASAAPATAQSGTTGRAARAEQRRTAELRATQEAQAAHAARLQREHSALAEALRAAEHQGVQQRLHAELEAVLHDQRALEAATLERHRAELEATLHDQRALEPVNVERHRAELEAALAAAHADRAFWHEELAREGPPEGWAPQDPADPIWKRAREQLNAGDYAAAAQLFRRIRTESAFAKSAYRPDSFYWEAFALSRRGGAESLREAKRVLEELEKAYPPGERSPDARALATRIDGELAGRGSADAARQLQERVATVIQTLKPSPAARVTAAASAAQTAEARAWVDAARAADVAKASTYQNLRNAWGENFTGAMLSGQLVNSLYRAQSLPFQMRSNPQCQNDEEEIRLIALNALVEMDDSAALPALREVLARRDECAPQMRRHAMMILARRESPGTEALALEAARNDPDPEVRQMALTWLIEKDNGPAFDIAQSLLGTGTERDTRQIAIMALARSRNERARQILRDFVRSDAPVELRGEALMALPLSRGADDRTFLRQVFGESQNRQLKEYALMAMGRRTLEGEGEWLLGIARDASEDIELRTQALWMLRSDDQVSATAIAAVYDTPGERRLREAALMILTERSRTDAAALDKLIALARAEPDADLRKQAVMALARSKEPRAQATLLEIVRKR